MMYVQAVAYMALALYLSKIVPQQYGVALKWDYLWKKHDASKKEEDSGPVPEYETALEDADAKTERNYVYSIDREDY